jgi:thiol-disulfide isomerase/thioredoxin
LNLNKKKLQKIPLHASVNQKLRFEWSTKEDPVDVRKKYSLVFDDDTEKNICVGLFKGEQGIIQGTIMTETGDYRFLDGNVNGNSFKMSTFNGTWAMLVEGQIKGDSIVGYFYSGSSYRTGWRGKADDNAMLRKASSLTYVLNDQAINFSSVRTLNGKLYRSKQNSTTKLYQIMGSWCPNCLDEMVFFKELHKEFAKDGLEIIAFAYENQQEISSALSKLKKFAKRMEIPYTICYAGNASKEVASATFPMLNQIMSFPTSILVDKNGKIRHIHTGFSGPATGKVYDEYKEEMRGIIKSLLVE